MQKMWRSVLILLALFSTFVIISAQDEAETENFTVVGSGIVNPAFESMVEASETELTFDVSTTGTSAGFEQFCAGTADIATANRAISTEETAACGEAGIEYMELLVGYDVLAIISNPADIFTLCLTSAQLDSIFAPSATGVTTNWSQLNPVASATDATELFPELEMQVFLPEDTTLTYAELDNVISGVGFRADATITDFDSIIEAVSTTSGAIGAVPYEMTVVSDVQLVGIEFPASTTGCLPPDVAAAEDGLYPASIPLFVYVNKAVQGSLGDFLTFLAGEEGSVGMVNAGFSPVSIAVYGTNAAILAGEQDSQEIITNEPSFEVPPNLTGSVTVGGATTGFSLAEAGATNLTANNPNLTITRDFSGNTIGINSFCSGELNVLFVNGDGAIACDGDTPETVTASLSYQAVVLVANAADDYTTCLTTEQIRTIWSASSADTIMQWNDVAETMPEQDITLFAIRDSSDILSDIMLTAPDGAALPIRIDTEINVDPLYRAAAVANVPGSLTYMRWSDYERVLNNEQERIQLVLVDGGNGCTQPSVDTITSGEYPLVRETSIVINKASLADVAVQSYTWTLFDNSTLSYLTSAGFVGVDETDLARAHEQLFTAFTEAMISAAEATPEATPEVTPEATEEAPESGD